MYRFQYVLDGEIMTFTYFKKTSEYHFNRNDIDDYDGDDGYFFEYYVDDIDVHIALAEFIFEDCILCAIPNMEEVQQQIIIKRLCDFISDCDLVKPLKEPYKKRLHDRFEQDALESEDNRR